MFDFQLMGVKLPKGEFTAFHADFTLTGSTCSSSLVVVASFFCAIFERAPAQFSHQCRF